MPDRVVTTTTSNDNAVGNAQGASTLIQTVVWSIVVLVILIVGIFILVHYNIL